jgi:hypothetical protein
MSSITEYPQWIFDGRYFEVFLEGQSSHYNDKLLKANLELNINPTTLKQRNVTKWNSVYYMIISVVHNKGIFSSCGLVQLPIFLFLKFYYYF